MAGASFLERAMDAEEWGGDDLDLPPRHLLVEEVRDYKCGFPVTYISFPCHPLEDCCDGGEDDSDKITNHSRPGSEGKLGHEEVKTVEFYNSDREDHYNAVDNCRNGYIGDRNIHS
ncbi:hypothetical protein OIU74_005370 [Salix koriyanagi]|uniref:Uncharacterized protein n=1 Tax=Salix koriyanagi TaxID=2511006 RepID=A0A9Q0UNU2_9ROSI|nr:hypothetical protein OIU74_005370 [Salix koriyanagi]